MSPQSNNQPQQTVADLGRMVKAKYPGQYDDLIDAEVGARVKARYPGAYGDFADISAQQTQQQPYDFRGKTLQEQAAHQNVVPLSSSEQTALAPLGFMAGGATQFGRGLSETKSGWTNRNEDQFTQGLSDTARGAGTLALPFVVPELATTRGLIGTGVGAATGYGSEKAARMAGMSPGDAALLGTTVGGVFGTAAAQAPTPRPIDPDTALWQGVPMRVKPRDFAEFSPTVRGDIKLAAGNRPITDVSSLRNSVQAAKAINRGVMEMYDAPYRQNGVQFPTDIIADNLEANIPQSLRIESKNNPAAASQLQDLQTQADAYRSNSLTIDQLKTLQAEANAQLNAIEHGTMDAKNAKLTQRGTAAQWEAIANGARRIRYQYQGPDAANVQQRWGYLDDVDAGLDAADKKVWNAKSSVPAYGAAQKAIHPLRTVDQFLQGTTNNLIARAFAATEPGAPLPTPQPSAAGQFGMPMAAGPGRQLPPATPQMGSGPTTASYVSTSGLPPAQQANVWQGIGGQRQLPPGTAPFSQGTSVPDVLGRPDLRTGYRGGLLPPPEPGQPPINVQPRGPQSINVPPSPVIVNPGMRSSPLPAPRMAPMGAGSPRAMPPATGDSIGTKIGKQVWNAIGGPPIQ